MQSPGQKKSIAGTLLNLLGSGPKKAAPAAGPAPAGTWSSDRRGGRAGEPSGRGRGPQLPQVRVRDRRAARGPVDAGGRLRPRALLRAVRRTPRLPRRQRQRPVLRRRAAQALRRQRRRRGHRPGPAGRHRDPAEGRHGRDDERPGAHQGRRAGAARPRVRHRARRPHRHLGARLHAALRRLRPQGRARHPVHAEDAGGVRPGGGARPRGAEADQLPRRDRLVVRGPPRRRATPTRSSSRSTTGRSCR